jgi:hypothetical protein
LELSFELFKSDVFTSFEVPKSFFDTLPFLVANEHALQFFFDHIPYEFPDFLGLGKQILYREKSFAIAPSPNLFD